MAFRKTTNKKKTSPPAKAAAPTAAPVISAVRNSAVPPKAIAKKGPPTREQIAVRAFEIHMGGTGGSEFENWVRAERELRGL